MADQRPVLAVVGPTASEKSALALDVARGIGAEIVAVDAFTVYRGMDIGTAKPMAAQRRDVPHHCIDLLDPTQACTVEWFRGQARAAIADVRSRDRVPVLVGGSGLYFRSVVDDLTFPPTDPAVRAALEERFAGDAEGAHAALAAADPEAASRMEPNNLRRAVRALEVIELTGRPFSSWRRSWDEYQSIYPTLHAIGIDVEREDNVAAIDARVHRMLDAGWLDECRRLRTLDLSHTARQAIGYAELFAVLDGTLELDAAVERIKARTRQFSARQLRWFRADPRIRWVGAAQAPAQLRALTS